jgi:hypothetical protein
MQTTAPAVRVTLKTPIYLIQEPLRGLYARIREPAPGNPQPAEDNLDSVCARPSHVEFGPWQLATWYPTHDAALKGFARNIGVAPLEIVRREP